MFFVLIFILISVWITVYYTYSIHTTQLYYSQDYIILRILYCLSFLAKLKDIYSQKLIHYCAEKIHVGTCIKIWIFKIYL